MIDFTTRFAQAKTGSPEATEVVIGYFMKSIDQQLQNMNLQSNEYYKRYHECLKAILLNIHKYYDYEHFMSVTLKEIKEIIYLNKPISELNSSQIITESDSYIKSRVSSEDFDSLDVPLIYRECAKSYYIDNMTIEDLANMYRCTATIIYKRLRTVANAIFIRRQNHLKETDFALNNRAI